METVFKAMREWVRVNDRLSDQIADLVPPNLAKHAIRPPLNVLLGIQMVRCLFITVSPLHALVQHISFSSQT